MSLCGPVREFTLVAMACALVICVPVPAAVAQSIFNDLFGFTLQLQKPRANTSTNPYAYGSSRSRQSSGRYRTFCVRTCDGYYFPVSHATRRSEFYDEAKRCQARCPGQARLFYAPPGGSDITWATDVSGLTYKDLKTAFLYRKTLVKGCSCRPAPWAPEERARHKMYETEPAEIATLAKGNAGIDSLVGEAGGLTVGGRTEQTDQGGDGRLMTDLGRPELWKIQPRTRPLPRSLSEMNKNPSPWRIDHYGTGARTSGSQFLWGDDGR